MAQVRKFQSGGKTFKINGKTYNTSNSEDMKRLEEMASNSEYGGIAQQILANVNDAAYDNTLNVYRTSDGRVMMEGGLQNVADQYMSQGTQKATQRKDNAWNNTFKRRSGKDWINNLDSFLNAFDTYSSVKTSDTKSSDKIKVEKVNGSWKYNDKDGGWDEASVDNNLMLKRWNLLKDYVSAEDKSKYDVSSLDQDKLNAFMDMYKADPNLFKKYEPYFKANVTRPDNFSDFYSTFGWFGFEEDPVKAAKVQQQNEEDIYKKRFADAGYDYEKWAPYIDIDDKGNVTARKDDQGRNVFAALGGNGNYWFNDNFTSYSPENSFLKGHFLIGDRIYKESDANKEGSDLYNYLRRSGGFYDLNNTGQYDASNNLINWMWGSNAYIRPETETNLAGDFYNSGVRIDNTNYKTGNTAIIGSDYILNDDDQIIKYVNLNNPSNEYGLRNENYAIVDRFGNVRTHNGVALRDLNGDYFSNLLTGALTPEQIEAQQILREKRISTDKGDNLYYNRYAITGNPYFDLYVDPSSNGDVIMNPKGELTNTWLEGNKKGIRISKEIAEILQKPEFINALQTDPDFAKKFRNTIQGLTGTDWQDLFKRNLNKTSEFPGIKEEDARKIIEFFYNSGSNVSDFNVYARRNSNDIVNLPQFKNGGELKLQTGGAINAGSKQNESKLKIEEPVKSHTEQARLGIDKLSAAEKAELASIGMDVLGTAAGFFGPMGDMIGSGVGIAASATQLGADISRAGRLTGKDALRFAKNVGLDALGLVPVLGDASRAAKTIKNVQKASKWLSPLFIGAGLTSAAGSVDKIMKGETLTVDDWGNLAAGFQAMTNLGVAGKRRYDMSKITSLNSKLPKNTPKTEYKYSIGDKTVTLGEGQIGDVTSKNKKDAQEYLADLFTKEGVEEKDIPKDLAKRFGFVEGKTKWSKISEPKQEKQIEDRSAAGFFFRPGLNSYLEKNKNNLKIIAKNLPKTIKNTESGNNGITVYRTDSSIEDKSVSRILASLGKAYGVNLPISKNGKTHWSTIADDVKEIARITPTNGRVLSEANSRIRQLPIKTIPDFIPLENITRRWAPKSIDGSRGGYLFTNEVDLRPNWWTYSPKYALIATPSTNNINDIIKDWRNEFDIRSGSTRTSSEANTMKLFMRLKSYKQAFANINNKASFDKLINNIKNDMEFRIAMEENPGLLRQEMLDAANRAGLLGKNRKELVKGLVFKKGGVLKGQKGLWDLSKELMSGIDLSKLGQKDYKIGEDGLLDTRLDIAGMARRSATPETKSVITSPTPVTTNYATDHAYGSGNETKATKQVGDYWSQRRATEQFGGRPTENSDFEWGYLAKEMAGIGNSLAARKDAKKFLDLSNQKADIYSKGQPAIWNGRGRMRFQTPTMNLVNQQIAANNTIAGMMNTADAQANIAGKLSLAETNSKLFNQGIGMVSQELTNQLNAYDAQRRENDKLTFETANNARQWAMNTGMLRNAGQTEYVTNMGAIRDKDFVKLQSDINRFGMIDAQKQSMIDKLNLQRNTPGLSENQIASIDAQIAQIKSPEYNNILRRQAMYGSVASAKKGTKLRSTTEQMLLDNNKIVAKAISKLSDNTMKLILKAMS